ncbi:hypothetical protein Leryth_002562 [Lithospermum erythrorhizon]|nr:hypothetical protein Leryth_002562 [Lithospermum erythrorhizon]
MEQTLLVSCFAILVIFLVTWKLVLPTKRYKNLPPHPKPTLPIIGHLHLLKNPVHRTLQKLSIEYGPIFSLSFGSRLVVVVSNPSAVEECFMKNDIIFANRPSTLAGKYIGYNESNLAGLPYGDEWRNLRRLAAEEIFSPTRLKNFQSIRQDETKRLLQSLFESSKQMSSFKVELKSKFSEMTFNVILRMIAGKRYFGDESNKQEAKKLRVLINDLFEQADASNPEDLLPFLQWIDFRGLEKSLAMLGKKLDGFFQELVDEHRKEKRNTMISHLLALQESDPKYYTDQTIKGLIMVMITAGTDTSAVTIEWAMSLLLNHPNVLEKAKNELDSQVGQDRLVDEADLSNLHYLQCIILETLRLFPAAPLLLPHVASKDCKVQGYDIPRDTMLIVNAWAIHRDPLIWEASECFRPERFEGKTIDPFTLMPFGRGRRQCPGSTLANKVVGLTLASLIYCFEWRRETEEKVNLDEGKGLTSPKAEPLVAICTPRNFTDKIFYS